jgi:hypothetical protein
LAEVGVPSRAIPIALLFLNVGVEIGQLLFVASVAIVMTAAARMAHHIDVPQPAWLWRIPLYEIGAVASLWRANAWPVLSSDTLQ